jgi:hypothetical protein
MRMTEQEFNRAVDLVRQNLKHNDARERALMTQIVAAASLALNPSGDTECFVTMPEIVQFLDGMDNRARQVLKRIAEDLELKGEPLN